MLSLFYLMYFNGFFFLCVALLLPAGGTSCFGAFAIQCNCFPPSIPPVLCFFVLLLSFFSLCMCRIVPTSPSPILRQWIFFPLEDGQWVFARGYFNMHGPNNSPNKWGEIVCGKMRNHSKLPGTRASNANTTRIGIHSSAAVRAIVVMRVNQRAYVQMTKHMLYTPSSWL